MLHRLADEAEAGRLDATVAQVDLLRGAAIGLHARPLRSMAEEHAERREWGRT